MEKVKVRPSRRGDAQRISELYSKGVLAGKYSTYGEILMGHADAAKKGLSYLKKYVMPSTKWFMKSPRSHPRFSIVATIDGEIVGFAQGSIDSTYRRKAAYLSDVVVDSKWRGRGIYSALHREFERFARAHGAGYLMLDTNPVNRNMQDVTKGKGYKHVANVYLKKI